MVPLDSPRWSELRHAYGSAEDIPPLLKDLESFPGQKDFRDEPWYSLWSALCHQEDIYTASFAAVPHIIRVLAINPLGAHACFFLLPAQIEICRCRDDVPIPPDIKQSYFDALSQLPRLVAAASAREWDSDFLLCVLSAIAAAKGSPLVAEAVLELDQNTVTKFIDWVAEQ